MGQHDVEQLRRTGAEALNGGRADLAAQAYIQAVQHQPNEAQNWLGLSLALALSGDTVMLGQAAGLWGKLRGDAFGALFDILTMLMTYGRHDAVLALAAAHDGDHMEALPGLYYAGCVHVLRDDEDTAFDYFARFKALAALYRDRLPIGEDQPFNVAYRQGMLVEDRAYMDGVMARPLPPPPALTPCAPLRLGSAPMVVVSACNGAYFRLFGADYLRAAAAVIPGATIHMHVVDPPAELAEEAQALADELPMAAINVSWEPKPVHATAAYFASSRFLIARQLLDLYRRDLLITDIDVEFIADPTPLLPALAEFAFASYVHSGFGPASRYVANITHFSQHHGGRDVADAVAAFVHSKLDVPWPHNWMLDQAALMSGMRWLRAARPELRIGRLNTLFGRHFDALVRQQDRQEEKSQAIRAAG